MSSSETSDTYRYGNWATSLARNHSARQAQPKPNDKTGLPQESVFIRGRFFDLRLRRISQSLTINPQQKEIAYAF